MNRRDVFVVGAAGVAASVTSHLVACAEQDAKKKAAPEPAGHDNHENHDMHKASAGGAKVNRHSELAAVVAECITAGEVCLAHCIELLSTGDKSLGPCAKRVTEMLALCRAMGTLAAADSSHLPALAGICAAACSDCEKECAKHEKHHAECRGCAEACRKTIAQAKAIAK